MEQQNNSFQYTYSAAQRTEVEKIRKKYLPPEEDKMEQLRRLDQSATTKGTVISLIVGILGALIMGTGMCCVLVWMGVWFIPGIIIGLAGIALICCAYPTYTRITEKERERIAPEILRLAAELMNN